LDHVLEDLNNKPTGRRINQDGDVRRTDQRSERGKELHQWGMGRFEGKDR
jgi:hypothetical protein